MPYTGNSEDKIREKIRGHEFEFQPEFWTNMEDKLDKHQKRRKGVYFGLFALLIALGTAGNFVYQNLNSPANVAEGSALSFSGQESATISCNY